ncbi:MAG: glycosyl hydrolase 53 family protein [Balneolaceae bacterium]
MKSSETGVQQIFFAVFPGYRGHFHPDLPTPKRVMVALGRHDFFYSQLYSLSVSRPGNPIDYNSLKEVCRMRCELSMVLILLTVFQACSLTNSDDDLAGHNNEPPLTEENGSCADLLMGADLSYLNQVLDYGGTFRDAGEVRDPWQLFADYGTDIVRLRKWHNPVWTAELYGDGEEKMYNGLKDVEEGIRRSKENDMDVLLDFHYSDLWADPGRQEIPAAWLEINDLEVLSDSIYNYTYKTLEYLNSRGLMPEMVQIGNETNCGLLYSNAPSGFPKLNGCDGHWDNLAVVFNSAIRAVRDVAAHSETEPQIALHVAQPENVVWWFDHMISAGTTDFDIAGFSYYSAWSDEPIENIGDQIAEFRSRYSRDVLILETAYPWTLEDGDGYGNIFDAGSLINGYPATSDGQKRYMEDLANEVKRGDGQGIIYWEPAWITSNLKHLWGEGSSWDNNTFFDHEGNTLPVFETMTCTAES